MEFSGLPAEGDLEKDFEVVDDEGELTLKFYEVGPDLWVDARLTGSYNVKVAGVKTLIDDPGSTTIKDVEIDGVELSCTYKLGLKKYPVNGEFGEDFQVLDILIDGVGEMTLDRQ